jgi:hypothetical protein
MVTWMSFKNHLLEVGLTQKRETMALRMLTTAPHELAGIGSLSKAPAERKASSGFRCEGYVLGETTL